MAEIASTPDLNAPSERTRRAQTAKAATVTSTRNGHPASRASVASAPRREAAPLSSPLDRYAFYFFMGTVALGVIAMIVLSFSI